MIPLFLTFPYRVNIFLSWEGAYRMSQGQIPFRDFGTPIGGMFWVVPAIFFKLFGPQMISLIKAQVFINIVGGLAFRTIMKRLSVAPAIRLIAVILFCLSYSFFNFWPWYNHTVIIYELIALAFLFRYLQPETEKPGIVWLFMSALFVCFSVFTKQDGGGMAFMVCSALLVYHGLSTRQWKPIIWFILFFGIVLLAVIYPLSRYSFGYWFNHGQAPHSSRVSLSDIVIEFLGFSQWIKFYIFLIVLLLFCAFRQWKELWSNRPLMYFVILVMAILAEAAIFQVTSYTPPDNNIFFHCFAVALILTLLSRLSLVSFEKPVVVIVTLAGILLWWSGTYEKYIDRILFRLSPQVAESNGNKKDPNAENVVDKNTFMISNAPPELPMSEWTFSKLEVFDKIYMPKPTIEGMDRLMKMDLVKSGKAIKVLNMSELTPLAAAVPFALEANQELPLWHHLGVGMFNRQAAIYEKRIAEHYYDLILFEYIPRLNNFYPFRTRDSLTLHYQKVDSFMAPRRGETVGNIEVYIKP